MSTIKTFDDKDVAVRQALSDNIIAIVRQNLMLPSHIGVNQILVIPPHNLFDKIQSVFQGTKVLTDGYTNLRYFVFQEESLDTVYRIVELALHQILIIKLIIRILFPTLGTIGLLSVFMLLGLHIPLALLIFSFVTAIVSLVALRKHFVK